MNDFKFPHQIIFIGAICIFLMVSIFFYLEKAGPRKDLNFVKITSNEALEVFGMTALLDDTANPLLCESRSLPYNSQKTLLWNIICEPAHEENYIGLYWKRPDLPKFDFQNRVINNILRRKTIEPNKPLNGTFNCTENKTQENLSKIQGTIVDCLITTENNELIYTNFIYFYPAEYITLDAVPVIVLIDSNKKNIDTRLNNLYPTFKKTSKQATLLNSLVTTTYASGPGAGAGDGAGIGDGSGVGASGVGDPGSGVSGSVGDCGGGGCGGYVPPGSSSPSPSPSPASEPGVCGSTVNSCVWYSLGYSNVKPDGSYEWSCDGRYGGAPAFCWAPAPAAASCEADGWLTWGSCNAYYSGRVSSGGSVSVNNTASGYTGYQNYTCTNGTWGWTGESCAPTTPSPTPTPSPPPSPSPINGTCSSYGANGNEPINSCNSGVLGTANPQPNGDYHWYCDGINGGGQSPLCWYSAPASPTPSPTPTPAVSCSADGPLSWGSCSAYYSGTVSSGNSVTVNNTAPGYSGYQNYTCNNGNWAWTGESCVPTSSSPTPPPATPTPSPIPSCPPGYSWNGVICEAPTPPPPPPCPFAFPTWTGSDCVAPMGTIAPNSCTIATGASSCSMNVAWSVTNPPGTVEVRRNYGGGSVMATGATGNSSYVFPYGSTPFVLDLYDAYRNVMLANAEYRTSCAIGGWDSVGGVCANPSVVNVEVTGQYYSTPGTISFTCSNSNSYTVRNADTNTIISSGVYSGPKDVGVTTSGNYSIICRHGSVPSTPAIRYYNAPPPPLPIISISSSPRTLSKGGSTTINWDIQFPVAACTFSAKSVCTNGICNATQLASQSALTTKLRTERTDISDKNGHRLLTTAIRTIAPGHLDTDWRALGKKTVNIQNTTDITINCGNGRQATTRVHVTSSIER